MFTLDTSVYDRRPCTTPPRRFMHIVKNVFLCRSVSCFGSRLKRFPSVLKDSLLSCLFTGRSDWSVGNLPFFAVMSPSMLLHLQRTCSCVHTYSWAIKCFHKGKRIKVRPALSDLWLISCLWAGAQMGKCKQCLTSRLTSRVGITAGNPVIKMIITVACNKLSGT